MADINREREIFEACLKRPRQEWSGYLRAACGGDDLLQDRLLRLLAAHDRAEAAPTRVPARVLIDLEEGDRIGPYRILQTLGEGGMGIVYEAQQLEPVRRRVALKIIKLGMDTREVVNRFEAERQALAVMDHPHIARVLDAGATDHGRPYFVMEVVRGIPLLDYCDRYNLSARDRLELFIPLCDAVQHAHQKGVVHRDLKPSNVLVSHESGRPVPKVIDFGIAKAMGRSLTDKTVITLHGQAMGTPAYMSPEQAEISGLDVDTRTDVYSLGVMLYELLVGKLPVDPREEGVPGFVARLARGETHPPTPSTRLAELGAESEEIARRRTTDPQTLKRQLEGDLDWIVMRAMESDRGRRYQTASDMAADIERYLREEPVSARPPSRLYKMKKFIRRHRVGVAVATMAAGTIAVALLATTMSLLRARRAEAAATREAQAAVQISDFLVGLFKVSDPNESPGAEMTAREILDRGANSIEHELTDQPVTRARMLHTIARVYWELGLEKDAESLVRRAIELRRLHASQLEVAQSLRLLARVLTSHFGGIEEEIRDEIAGLLRESRAIHERELGGGHPEVAEDLLEMGYALSTRSSGNPERRLEAVAAYGQALEILQELHGPGAEALSLPLNRLGAIHRSFDPAAAADYYGRSLRILEPIYGATSGRLLDDLYGLYDLAHDRHVESDEECERWYRRLWAISENEIVNHDVNIGLYINLGNDLAAQGRFQEADSAFQRAGRLAQRKYGLDQELVAVALSSRTGIYLEQGRWPEAEETARQAAPLWQRNNRTVSVATSGYRLALALVEQGKWEEAEAMLTDIAAVYAEHSRRWDYPTALYELAELYRRTGRQDRSEGAYRRLLNHQLEMSLREDVRDSDLRFAALGRLGCEEQWKRTFGPVRCTRPPVDRATALQLAKRAVEKSARKPVNLRVLAIARYLNGDRDGALEAIDQALGVIPAYHQGRRNYEEWRERFENGWRPE